MNKTTEALKLAETLVEDIVKNATSYDRSIYTTKAVAEKALAAIREALAEPTINESLTVADHISDAGKVIADHSRTTEGCDYCKHPLFAGTKCNNCGEVTLAEPVKQELNWGANKFMPHEQPVKQDPVAKVTVRPFNPMDASCPTTEVKWLMKPVSGFLYAAPVDAKAIRAEALEEAAEYVDRNLYTAGEYAEKLRERAAAIRGLK